MPPSKKRFINALIFKKQLAKNLHFVELHLAMRDSYLRKIQGLST